MTGILRRLLAWIFYVRCPECGGQGELPVDAPGVVVEWCEECHGTGLVPRVKLQEAPPWT